jgi:putative transcriptional regulator
MKESPTDRISDRLAPGFIAAMPQLVDPNFHRTVVFVLRHGDSGAFGLIVNRSADMTVAELCRSQEIPYRGPADHRVMIGGPVEQEHHLLVLHGEPPTTDPPDPDDVPVVEGIRLVTSREALVRLTERGARRLRCYIGYAGWGPGQLDDELAEGAWVPLPVTARFLFDEPPETVWESALRQAGIDPATLAPGGQLN